MLADAPVTALLPCVDIERARKFYGQTLGLKEADDLGPGGEASPGTATYQCGQGTRLGIYERPQPPKADHTAAGWMVDDIDSVVDELLARGVEMETYDMPGVEFDERGVATAGGMKSVWFKDPDGNTLSILQTP